jgi:exonuclease III
MKLATWNFNSLKVRLPKVLQFLAGEGLQELRHTS